MKPFDRVIAISQLFMLAAWEALGLLFFDWNGWTIAAVWFVGLWSFNILTATAVRTYGKLMEPQISVVGGGKAEDITPEDIGG